MSTQVLLASDPEPASWRQVLNVFCAFSSDDFEDSARKDFVTAYIRRVRRTLCVRNRDRESKGRHVAKSFMRYRQTCLVRLDVAANTRGAFAHKGCSTVVTPASSHESLSEVFSTPPHPVRIPRLRTHREIDWSSGSSGSTGDDALTAPGGVR